MNNHTRRNSTRYTLLFILLFIFATFMFSLYKIHERKELIKKTSLSGIVASSPVVHSLISMITQGVSEPILLTSPQMKSLHNYSLKPNQIRILQDANLVFLLADEFETFLSYSVPINKKVEIAKDPIITLRSYQVYDMNNFLHKTASRDLKDYHIWLDPKIALKMLEVIYNEVIKRDKHNSKKYTRNYHNAVERINTLNTKINEVFINSRGVNYVTYLQSLGYLEKAFGVHGIGAIFIENNDHTFGYNSHSTKRGKKPSDAQYIEQVVNFIKTSEVDCIFKDDPTITDINFGKRTGIKQINLNVSGFDLQPGIDLYENLMIGIAKQFNSCKNNKPKITTKTTTSKK